MKKFLIMALAAATVIAAQSADAKDWHKKKPLPSHHHSQQYPKGWGPHRGPDRAGYFHGYRGYHDHRPGYRRGHDGFWYPAAAFAIGAIIGGALNN